MSHSAEMLLAAAEAQTVLAEIGGALPGRKNTLYNGTPLLAVYGAPQVDRQMLPSGGYKQRTYLPASITRAQLGTPPTSGKQWTRTDCTPQITYRIESVGTHDSVMYSVVLVRPGE
jgi:hypothetical protein